MYVPKALVLLAMAMSASALSTQHIARNVHHRRHALAGRDAAPETPVAAPSVVPRKRSIKRCKAGNPNSSLLSSSAVPTSSAVVSSAVPTSSAVVSSAVPSSSAVSSSFVIEPSSSAADNVAASSSVVSSTSETPVATSTPPPPPPSSSSEAPVPSSSVDVAPSSSVVIPTPISTSVAPIISISISTSAPPPPPPPSSSSTPAETPSSSAPAASPSPTGSGGDGGLLTSPHTGDATWYETGLGACGINNNDGDYIVAVSKLLFDTFPGYDGVNPNNNPICNMKATATYNGKSVPITITDRCEACAMFSLDFSPSAFSQLADQSVGRLEGMVWTFDI